MPPVIGAIGAIAAIFTAIGFSTGVASAIAVSLLSTGVSLALSGVAKLFMRRPVASISTSGTQFNVRQPVSSWRIIYGTMNVAGVFTYIETTGVNKEFLHFVITLAGHEVESIGNVYFDSKVVLFPAAGGYAVWQANHQFATGWRIYENGQIWICGKGGKSGAIEPTFSPTASKVEDGKIYWNRQGKTNSFENYTTVEKNLGTDSQTAFPNLVSASDGLWTSAHRQRGKAGVHIRLEFNSSLFPTGVPNITFDIEGKKVEDTRLSPPSEVFSHNPALCIRDYLLNTRFGMGVDPARIDEDSFIAAANICDEEVDLRDTGSPLTTEPRYTMNGVFDTGQAPVEIMQAMLSSCAGRLIYTNGKYRLFVGAYITANPVAIDEDDLRGPITVDTRTSKRDLFNGVRGVYISAANFWQPTDFPPYQGAGYVTEDQGEEIWKQAEYPFTTSRPMAQRLSKIMLEKVRRQLTIQLKCKLSQYEVAPLDTIKVTNQRFGWTDKTFEVVDCKLATEEGENQTLVIGVDIQARETDANVYAWDPDTDETLIADDGVVNLPDPLTVEPVTYLALQSDDSTSLLVDGIRYPRILATWSPTPDQFVIQGGHLEVYLKKYLDTIGTRVATLPGDAEEVYIGPAPLEIGEEYAVEVVAVAVNAVRASSGYSDLVEVSMTSSGVLTGAGNRAYRPLTNPLTATDAGATATIDVDNWTNRVQGAGDIAYDSGAITGLDFNTLYYIYFDDPDLEGGTVTYVASETKEDALDAPGRFFLGSCRTPQNGGPDTAGNNDGGAGAQTGQHSILLMSGYTELEAGNGAVSDPQYAIDEDQNNYATLQTTGNSGTNDARLDLQGPPGLAQRSQTLTLKILVELPTNSYSGSTVAFQVSYGYDGTAGSYTVVTKLAGQTLAKTLYSIPLPTEVNPSQVKVRFNIPNDSSQASGTCIAKVYGAWLEVDS